MTARILLSSEADADAFHFYADAGQTYYDASDFAIRCQTQTIPDPLGNFDWVDAQGGDGFGFTDGFYRVQRATWGGGKTAIVLTVELVSQGGTQVFLFRIKGDAFPDMTNASAANDFAATISNKALTGTGFDLDAALAFTDVPRHTAGSIDTLFTPEGFGDAWTDGIVAGAGNDTIYGTLNDDTLRGGDGNDSIGGHWGYNLLFGGDGNDTLSASSGPNYVGGNLILGGDTLFGGNGNDSLGGGAFGDTLGGGNGDDTLSGDGGGGFFDFMEENGPDILMGGAGNDGLWGGDGRDALFGGGGRDTLVGDRESDTLSGGSGRDMFVFRNDSGVDEVTDFDLVQDRLDMTGVKAAITVRAQSGNTVVEWSGGAIVFDHILKSDFMDAGLLPL